MKHLILYVAAGLISATPAFAEEREVANAEAIYLETDEVDVRSFFEPKTEADLSAMVALDKDLQVSLFQEAFN